MMSGKPVEESKAEITYAADFFWYYAGEASRIDGHYGMSYNGKGRVLASVAAANSIGPTILTMNVSFAFMKFLLVCRCSAKRRLSAI